MSPVLLLQVSVLDILPPDDRNELQPSILPLQTELALLISVKEMLSDIQTLC